jgi:hypothetical protein
MIRFMLGLAGVLGVAAALGGGAVGANGNAGSGCIAHRPAYIEGVFEPAYDADCSGHDEPELDPLSSVAGSAKDVSWTFILPSDGALPVSAVGPTFWFGGTVTDPASLFGQAFLEVQFYPDGILRNCNPNGSFLLTPAPNKFTVCSPVWSLTATGQKPNFHEPAAFNAMLTTSGNKHDPMVMNAGDEITIHFHLGPPSDGWHIDVSDNSTHQSGTIVLNSASGPLLPAFSTQEVKDNNQLGWGIVHDTPNSFVWEIGHTSPFSAPKSQFCLPGDPICDSYNLADWTSFSPLRIESVSLAGQAPTGYAVVSDFGGNAEIIDNCGALGTLTSFCNYPFYSLGQDGTFRYGGDYGGTATDFGAATQFPLTTDCNGPFGTDTTYCANQILP